MAHRRGFEPLTPRFVVWCSIQLSYRCLLRAAGLKAVAARRRRGNVTTSVNDRAPKAACRRARDAVISDPCATSTWDVATNALVPPSPRGRASTCGRFAHVHPRTARGGRGGARPCPGLRGPGTGGRRLATAGREPPDQAPRRWAGPVQPRTGIATAGQRRAERQGPRGATAGGPGKRKERGRGKADERRNWAWGNPAVGHSRAGQGGCKRKGG